MTLTTKRRLKPGTTGWSADDLEDPSIEFQWDQGRYEIVEGVLATMPAAYSDGGMALSSLIVTVQTHLRATGITGRFTLETDLVLKPMRVARVDAAFLSAEDLEKQRAANARRGKKTLTYGRLLVPPTLIVECLSLGHESHDRSVKRRWYAEAGVPNYWLLDIYKKTLECLVLDGDQYRLDVAGARSDIVRPNLFPGSAIELSMLWT